MRKAKGRIQSIDTGLSCCIMVGGRRLIGGLFRALQRQKGLADGPYRLQRIMVSEVAKYAWSRGVWLCTASRQKVAV